MLGRLMCAKFQFGCKDISELNIFTITDLTEIMIGAIMSSEQVESTRKDPLKIDLDRVEKEETNL